MARLLLAPTPFVQSWNPSVLVYSLLAPACSALLLMCVISIANLSSCVIGFKWMALLGRPEWLLHCCLTECLMCIFSLLCLFTCYHHIYIVLPFCLFFFFCYCQTLLPLPACSRVQGFASASQARPLAPLPLPQLHHSLSVSPLFSNPACFHACSLQQSAFICFAPSMLILFYHFYLNSHCSFFLGCCTLFFRHGFLGIGLPTRPSSLGDGHI